MEVGWLGDELGDDRLGWATQMGSDEIGVANGEQDVVREKRDDRREGLT